MRIDDSIKNIKEQAYHGIDSDMIDVRLRLLYLNVLENVSDVDREGVIENIIEYEKSECLRTIRTLSLYESPLPTDILSDNSKIAIHFASLRKGSGKSFPLAKYMCSAFTEFVKKEEMAFKQMRYRKVISETIVDFLYASGSSDMISFRLNSMMPEE